MPERRSDITELFVRDLDRIELPARDLWRPPARKESSLMRSSRYLLLAGAAAAVLAVALVVGFSLRDRNESVAVSPSPTPAASATPAAAATTTPTASPRAEGVHMSKRLNFALELPPPWHKAVCGDVENRTLAGDREVTEYFTYAGPLEESMGHTGFSDHRVHVRAHDNPRRLSPMEFTGGRNPVGSGAGLGSDTVRSTTLAGRPAAEFGEPGGIAYGYLVGEGDLMYQVYYVTKQMQAAPEPAAVMTGIVRSFRFLTASERQVLADPTPIPAAAPSAQALATSIKAAFEARDAAALERLLSPCLNVGVQNGGASLVTRQRFMADLRTQLAAGLAVTVDPGRMRTGDALGAPATLVRSQWNASPPGEGPVPSPEARTREVELILRETQGGFYWSGTLANAGN